MAPLVTVLVPTVGRMKYFPSALESVRAQTHDNLEILIGDNASTDGTATFIEKMKVEDPRIRSYYEIVRSLPVNWQHGLEEARGEYLTIVSDDDLVRPEFVARCMAQWQTDPALDVVTALHELIDADGAPLPNLTAYLQAAFKHYGAGRCGMHWRETEISSTIMCSVMRTAWARALGFRQLAGFAADADFFWRAAIDGYAAYFIHEPLVLYRTHPGAASATRVQQLLDTLAAQTDLEKQHAELRHYPAWQQTRRTAVEATLQWLLRSGHKTKALALFRENERYLSARDSVRFFLKLAAAAGGLYPHWIGRQSRDPALPLSR